MYNWSMGHEEEDTPPVSKKGGSQEGEEDEWEKAEREEDLIERDGLDKRLKKKDKEKTKKIMIGRRFGKIIPPGIQCNFREFSMKTRKLKLLNKHVYIYL